jgi:iron complex outermembrane receptor protein
MTHVTATWLRTGAAVGMGMQVVLAMACVRDTSHMASSEEAGSTAASLEQATHIEQRHEILQERQDSAISKVIVTREDIVQFRDRRAGDILRRLPGVVMSSPGVKNRSARLRGLGKQYTQVLINGERISGGGQKRDFELDRIPADMIERIEIIKSPSAEYNSDAVAGIVNIILRQPPAGGVFELMEERR